MKKRMNAMLLAIVICCLWAAPALAVSYGTVHGGWLRLRENPNYEATVLASYKNGTVVTVLNQNKGWAQVLTPDYKVGYMDMRYLYISANPAPTPVPTAAPQTRTWTRVNRTAYVTSQNGKDVRMRNAPEVNTKNVMGLYPVGRKVTELRVSNDGWSYIKIDKKHGYMMSQFLTTGGTPVITATPRPVITATPIPVITATPAPVITATPVPTATPTPDQATITGVKINPYKPKVGDKIQVIVSPAGAEYTCVWYNDENRLLSTNKSYTVQETDVGHAILVRIQGVGASAGFVADGGTAKVQAAE